MSHARLKPQDHFRPKLIALSVAACFSLSATQASANPTGGTVSSGSATFSNSGNTLTITNTAGTIINWQSFSIGINEITRFLQSSSSSAVLNRVIGKDGVIPQSVIDGILSSNGRVFLLNSSGILIGSNARIDVAGFVASSLNLSDADFKAGRMRFTATPGAGKVSNAGTIDTTSSGPGGRVFLIGPDVENSGVIRTPQGQIVLAAGKTVELVAENSPFVTVNITADSEQALNVGQLIADSGSIGMFGALVRQGGVAQANSAVAGQNGEIKLIATKDLTLDAGSVTTANGPSGGNVTLQAQGGTNLVYGDVEAKGSSGQGGTIEALGVRVGLLGNGVIDASGDAGGGTVLVGGDQHGANPNIQNAQQTIIGPDGVIRADAGTSGDGGRVIVWSDQATQFYGSISARGGSQSGNGGFVETSGNVLQAFGSVNTTAPNGRTGNWLLDPTDVYISVGGASGLTCPTGICFGDAPTTSIISPTTINTNLFTTSVTIQAQHDIVLQTTLTLLYGGAGQTFTAQAGNNIDLGGNTITASGTNVTLIANDPSSLAPSGTGSIIGAGNITTSGGNVSLSGFGINVGTINTSGGALGAGSVTVSGTSDVTTGSITTQSGTAGFAGGSVDLFSAGGKVTVNGSIGTSGASGAAGANVDGSSGGGVTITAAGTAGVTGSIVTSGGNGANTANGVPGGIGGSAGAVLISGGGDASVQGNITARGGNGATGANSGATAGFAGSAGGLGGSVILTAGGNVSVATIDVGGGTGGAGAQAAQSTTSNPGLTGGAGGGAGAVELAAGQSVTVSGSILAVGGTGGAGGAGIPAIPTAGAGGVGGAGGLVLMTTSSPSGTVTTGTIRVDGGAGGVGGAYGGAGGAGGAALAVIIDSSSLTLGYGSVITAYGGAGGAGGPNGPAFGNAAGGNGGGGGNGGQLIFLTDSAVATSALSVLGGAGGAGGIGLSNGAAGLAGLDGLISIGLSFNSAEFDLATNTGVAATNGLTLVNTAPSSEELLKKDNKKKDQVAACK